MHKNKFVVKLCVTMLVITIISISAVVVNAASETKKTSFQGNNFVSMAVAKRTKATISSMAGSGTGSVQGKHKMTYRAEVTKTSGMTVNSITESFGGTGGILMKSNLYLVDYTKGKHVYKVTGVGSATINTKASY